MFLGLPCIQMERAEETYHRREAFRLVGGIVNLRFVATTDGENAFQITAVCADYAIKQVPRFDPQRFLAVERFVQIGGFKAGQSQQTFIHHGKGVIHRTPGLFANAEGLGAFRLPFFRRFHDRLQLGGGVFDCERNDAVQTDRTVILLVLVRLQQGHADVGVRCHVRGNRQRNLGALPVKVDPALFQNLAAGFDGEQAHVRLALPAIGFARFRRPDSWFCRC